MAHRVSIRSAVAPLVALVILANGMGRTSEAAAQMPDSFTNLQHFPPDISRDELVGHMRQLSFALGVLCQYCHTGGDGVSFEGVDFASDDKPQKRRARYMLEMTETINTSLLASLPERGLPNVEVECRTCHRGLPRPEMIDDLLRERIAEQGVESAVAEFRRLRDETYGSWSYDFGEWVINDLAREFAEDDPATTAALLRMNGEFHPESVSIWLGLGDAEADAGNREAAIAAFRRALEVDPENQRVLRRLEEIGRTPPSDGVGSVHR